MTATSIRLSATFICSVLLALQCFWKNFQWCFNNHALSHAELPSLFTLKISHGLEKGDLELKQFLVSSNRVSLTGSLRSTFSRTARCYSMNSMQCHSLDIAATKFVLYRGCAVHVSGMLRFCHCVIASFYSNTLK